MVKHVNERATPKTVLSRDSDTYRRIYDLLEEHTYSFITDEWSKNPTTNSVRIEQLEPLSRDDVLAQAIKDGVAQTKAIDAVKRYEQHVLLHINDQRVVVTKNVASTTMKVLADHVDVEDT